MDCATIINKDGRVKDPNVRCVRCNAAHKHHPPEETEREAYRFLNDAGHHVAAAKLAAKYGIDTDPCGRQ